jgi:hypothetical protein
MEQECNTVLPKVKSYIECSFGESTTNKTDKEYLEQIQYNMLEEYPYVKARNVDDVA